MWLTGHSNYLNHTAGSDTVVILQVRRIMDTNLAENVTDTAINLAHLKHEVSKAKVLIDDVLEDSKRKAERLVKRSVVATEDCIEDTTYYIKRHPWQSVGVALGFGAGVGILTGWLVTRRGATNSK